MTGLVIPLLLLTTKTYCSFHLIVNEGVVSGVMQSVVFTGSQSFTVLITTPTPSLVKTSLWNKLLNKNHVKSALQTLNNPSKHAATSFRGLFLLENGKLSTRVS